MFSKDDDYDYAFAVVYFLYNDGNVRQDDDFRLIVIANYSHVEKDNVARIV